MPNQKNKKNSIPKYSWLRSALTILLVILLAVVIVTPWALRLMYRADAQVALGNAKSVRTAARVAAIQQYAVGQSFSDASCEGGVAEGLYEDILALSKVPGDFWVMQTDETGYNVLRFVYREGEYTVWFELGDSEESSYEVYHDETMIRLGD